MGERGRLSAPAAFVVSLCARPCSAPGFEVWVRGLFSRGFLALSLLLDWPELGSGSVEEGQPAFGVGDRTADGRPRCAV